MEDLAVMAQAEDGGWAAPLASLRILDLATAPGGSARSAITPGRLFSTSTHSMQAIAAMKIEGAIR